MCVMPVTYNNEAISPTKIPSDGLELSQEDALVTSRELRAQYEVNWLLADVEKCEHSLRSILAMKNPNTSVLTELSAVLGDRYKLTGQPEILDEQVALLERASALNKMGKDSSLAPYISLRLGESLRLRFMHSGHIGDLMQALDIHKSVSARLSHDDSAWAVSMYQLGCTLFINHSRFGEADNITRSVSCLRAALAQRYALYVDRYLAQYFLAMALWMQYRLDDKVQYLNEALQLYRGIFDYVPSNHPDRWLAYNGLSSCLVLMYEHSRDKKQLDEAIECSQHAFDSLSQSNHNRIRPAVNYILLLVRRYLNLGQRQDLDTAIDVGRACLSLSHALRPALLGNYANAVRQRYTLTGDITDLDDSIGILRDIHTTWDASHPMRQHLLHELAHSLSERYRSHRHIEDLTESISLFREANCLGYIDGKSSMQKECLVDVLIRYAEDQAHTESIYEAISICKTRLELISFQKQPSDVTLLCRLAVALKLRFMCHHDQQDLDHAIALFQECLTLCPPGHSWRVDSLYSLSDALVQRFSIFHQPADHAQAHRLLLEVLETVPDQDPSHATYLFALAQLYLIPNTPIYSVHHALDIARTALLSDMQSPQDCLHRVLQFLKTLETNRSPEKYELRVQEMILSIYSLAIGLLPRVAYFGLGIAARLQVLSKADNLAANGAMQALLLDQPKTSIEILESGRAMFWHQYLRLRTPFEGLPIQLASELQDLALALEHHSSASISQGCSGRVQDDLFKMNKEKELLKRQQLSERFESLVQQARQIPSFERFMLPNTHQALAMSASRGPVVLLVTTVTGCRAVILESPTNIHQLNFSDISASYLQSLAQDIEGTVQSAARKSRAVRMTTKNRRRTEDVLGDLWLKVMRKIVEVLKLQKQPLLSCPRIWLCPTGPFNQLPLHAAGVYSRSNSREMDAISDYAMVSYIPTISALLKARQELPPSLQAGCHNTLLTAVSAPFRGAPLPFIVAEITRAKQHIPAHIPVDVLADFVDAAYTPDASPTVDGVMARLPYATVLHLACHGYQDPCKPLESGFLLKDGMLNIAQLMSLNLDQAFMAILSACETAKGDQSQPNQAIHLAAAMHFAGFKSVVGTMWAMSDIDGPLVAEVIYSELFQAGPNGAVQLDADRVPYALGMATQRLRAVGISASRWAPFMHLGV